jgi:hypothetical protein
MFLKRLILNNNFNFGFLAFYNGKNLDEDRIRRRLGVLTKINKLKVKKTQLDREISKDAKTFLTKD